MTFYAGIAVVPSLIVATWMLSLVVGDAPIARYAERLANVLPDQLGAPDLARALVEAGAQLGPLTALVAVIPASLYGEGLRRAFGNLRSSDAERGAAWRGRARVLPLFALAPALVLLVLAVTPCSLSCSARVRPRARLGIYLAFLVDWVAVSIPLTYVYRVAPSALSWRSATWGAFITGSMISGFVQGFVLLLALPLDIGRPFGGFRPVAAMAVVGLWMALLHILVLVGYQLTAGIDDRGGTPWHPPEPVGERGDDRDPDGGRAATPCRPGAN